MAVRQTGFALLSSGSVQEAHDFAVLAQAATLESRVPFVHFFDGFRTSHELEHDRAAGRRRPGDMVPESWCARTAPGRSAPSGRSCAARPRTRTCTSRLGRRSTRSTCASPASSRPRWTGWPGTPAGSTPSSSTRATRLRSASSSSWAPAARTVTETVRHLNERGERVGVLRLRLYRPFPAAELVAALPSTVRRIAVLDRTKEPGSSGEPLFLDVVTALTEAHQDGRVAVLPQVIGGRYGLSSKEFTPGMVAGIFAELALGMPRPRFTIGINDDVADEPAL